MLISRAGAPERSPKLVLRDLKLVKFGERSQAPALLNSSGLHVRGMIRICLKGDNPVCPTRDWSELGEFKCPRVTRCILCTD